MAARGGRTRRAAGRRRVPRRRFIVVVFDCGLVMESVAGGVQGRKRMQRGEVVRRRSKPGFLLCSPRRWSVNLQRSLESERVERLGSCSSKSKAFKQLAASEELRKPVLCLLCSQ